MNILHLPLAVITASALVVSSVQAEEATATTDPVGFVTVGITAGTGTAKRNTLFSVPLLEAESIDGQAAGVITGVTANTISNSNAGWTAGALSQPETPYLIQITSGEAEGAMFLIASSSAVGGAVAGTPNTSTTVTISSDDSVRTNLTGLGIVAGTDTYKIFACDTLSSFFGTPATTGIQGGSLPANADTIITAVNGQTSTYFFDVASNRWSRPLGISLQDASNVALPPYYGLQYARLANTPLSFVVTGGVPMQSRKVAIRNSGVTLLSQYWPTDTTLQSSGLQEVLEAGATPAQADTVILTTNGQAQTFWYDGSNWRLLFGINPPIANETVIAVGSTVRVMRKGTSTAFSTLSQTVPYDLD